MWLFHDTAIGIFEFVTSTSIFLVRTITKPWRILWAMFGVYLEIKGLLNGTPVAGTWASFIESDDTIAFTNYIYEFSIPMALGISIFVIVVPNIAAIMSLPLFQAIFSTQGKLVIIAITMFILGLLPAIVGAKKVGGKIEGLSSIQTLLGSATSFVAVVILIIQGILADYLSGMIPVQLLIRWLPLVLGSFVLGPSIGWFISFKIGTVDTTKNPPVYSRGKIIPAIGVFFGYCFLILAIFGTAFADILLPIQNIALYHPSGDGNTPVILPYSLSYNEMLKVPWYFLLPFSTIVYGCIFIGFISIVCGVIYTIIDESKNLRVWFENRKEEKSDESHTPTLADAESKSYLSLGSYDWSNVRKYFFSGGSKSQMFKPPTPEKSEELSNNSN